MFNLKFESDERKKDPAPDSEVWTQKSKLKTAQSILGDLGEMFRNCLEIFGRFGGYFGEMLGRFLGDVWEIFRRCLGDFWEMFWKCLGNVLKIVGRLLENVWEIVGRFLGKFWEIFGKLFFLLIFLFFLVFPWLSLFFLVFSCSPDYPAKTLRLKLFEGIHSKDRCERQTGHTGT